MEYVLCRDDIFYFTEKYLDIKLRPYQIAQLLEYLDTNKIKMDLLTISHRASGMSTINAIFILWKVLFYPNVNIGIIHYNNNIQYNFEYILDQLYTTMENKWDVNQSRNQVIENNTRCIKYSNGSRILYATHNNSPEIRFRGYSLDTLIIEDVFSMINPNKEKFKENINSIKPNIERNIIYTSTSLSETVQPIENDIHVKKMLIPWYCNCDLTLDWYKSKLNSLGNTLFMLEYGCTRGF